MKNIFGAVSYELLCPANFERAHNQFNQCLADSIFRWERSTSSDAHVVFIDATSNLLRLKQFTPCVVWVGEDSLGRNERCGWIGRISPAYTSIEFCYTLDSAAMFLLGRRGFSEKPAGDREYFAKSKEDERYYRLGLTVDLIKPFDTDKHIYAASILRRQWATAVQVANYSGLSASMVDRLLLELSGRGLLASVPAGPGGLGDYVCKVNRIFLIIILRIKILLRSKTRTVLKLGRAE